MSWIIKRLDLNMRLNSTHLGTLSKTYLRALFFYKSLLGRMRRVGWKKEVPTIKAFPCFHLPSEKKKKYMNGQNGEALEHLRNSWTSGIIKCRTKWLYVDEKEGGRKETLWFIADEEQEKETEDKFHLLGNIRRPFINIIRSRDAKTIQPRPTCPA